MKISTKGRYGLRFMIELAVSYEKGPVSLKQIGEKQEISSKYLEQIVTQLNRANLVRSIRGAQGGYILAKRPADITVGDVLKVTEGSMAFVDCTENGECCKKSLDCPAAFVWRKIKAAVDDVVDSISLEDLAEMAESSEGGNYII